MSQTPTKRRKTVTKELVLDETSFGVDIPAHKEVVQPQGGKEYRIKPELKENTQKQLSLLPIDRSMRVAACALSNILDIGINVGNFSASVNKEAKKTMCDLLRAVRMKKNTNRASKKRSNDKQNNQDTESLLWEPVAIEELLNLWKNNYLSEISLHMKVLLFKNLTLEGFVSSLVEAREQGIQKLGEFCAYMKDACAIGEKQESCKKIICIAVLLMQSDDDLSVCVQKVLGVSKKFNFRNLVGNLEVLVDRFGFEILLCLPFLANFSLYHLGKFDPTSLQDEIGHSDFDELEKLFLGAFIEEKKYLCEIFGNGTNKLKMLKKE